MDGTIVLVLIFLLMFIGGIGGYVFFVNQQMDEAGWNKQGKIIWLLKQPLLSRSWQT